MEFKNPLFFLLLLVLVPYIVWYVMRFKQSLPSLKVPDTTKYVKVPKTFRLYLMHLPFLLRIILISLVVCILARPQSRHSWSNTDVEGIDIMLAVDVSTSMLAQDFKPNRVEALKEIAQRFIEKRPNDNMGLTMFAGEAYTQCPLTTDHTVLMNLYNSVDCNMAMRGVIDDGTAIGDGIMNAILRLKESQAKSKVIILLTDGVNNSGNISPQTAAEIAKKYGIRIYTIGIGRNGMAPYPLPTGGTALRRAAHDLQHNGLLQQEPRPTLQQASPVHRPLLQREARNQLGGRIYHLAIQRDGHHPRHRRLCGPVPLPRRRLD